MEAAPSQAKTLERWIERGDVALITGLLVSALLVPVAFLVPYADEWLRTNYLADHSPWQWTVFHTLTWVVRPTAELIMGCASWLITQRVLPAPWTTAQFLAYFQLPYVVLACTLLALLYLAAVVLAGRRAAPAVWSVACAGIFFSLCASSDLGHAYYWADGYANVVLPFALLVLGMALACRRGLQLLGFVLLLSAAMGHEVFCIYGAGYCVWLALFRPGWRSRLGWAGAALALTGLLYAQTFSIGPATRSEAYRARTGIRYDVEGAWRSLQLIDVRQSSLVFVLMSLLIAAAHPRFPALWERAVSRARARRGSWALLVLGTLVCGAIPLASLGLKKGGKVSVGAYAVATELFVLLAAVLLAPLLSSLLERVGAYYRRVLHSVLPILLVAAALSPNLDAYRAAFRNLGLLRAQAVTYVQALERARGQRVIVVRPCHPFSKRARSMTADEAARYFGTGRVTERSCKRQLNGPAL